ncbi:MAG: ADP-ribosyltransferase [Polyangiaceae bacterium]
MSGTTGGSAGTGTGPGTGASTTSQSSNTSARGGSGAGAEAAGSSTGWKRATPTAQYMPNVLGCACHGIREAGSTPATGSAPKAKPVWKDAINPARKALGPVNMGGAAAGDSPASQWKKGVTPSTQPTSPIQRPTPPKAPAPARDPMDAFLDDLSMQAKNALAGHKAKLVGKYPTAKDTETTKMLEAIVSRLGTPEGRQSFKAELDSAKSDPLYAAMGPDKFASLLAWSDAMLEQSRNHEDPSRRARAEAADTYGLTPAERVAILGYTTGDYTAINPALRRGNSDASLEVYIDTIKRGLAKLPDYTGSTTVERGVGDGAWTKDAFVKGKDFKDGAFTSTATPGKAPMADWKVVILGQSGGKDVGIFSAWPAEAEVLYPPGTEYVIEDVSAGPPKTVTMRQKP